MSKFIMITATLFFAGGATHKPYCGGISYFYGDNE